MNRIVSYKLIKVPFIVYLGLFILGIIFGVILTDEALNPEFNPGSASFQDIFMNNILVGVSLFIGGLLTFGVLSSIIMFANGAIIGELLMILHSNQSLSAIIRGLLPHLWIELLGLISFSVAGSFSLFLFIQFFRTNSREMKYKEYIVNCLFLIAAGTVFLFVASLLEDWVSFVEL